MTKLNNKQAAVLANAANRPDGCLMPLPEGMSLDGGALTTMLRALERRGLTECSPDDNTWTITAAGRTAVAAETGSEADKRKDERAAPQNESAIAGKGNCNSTPGSLFRAGTRQAQLVDLLQRDEGAEIDEMMQLTGWQSHSVRGADRLPQAWDRNHPNEGRQRRQCLSGSVASRSGRDGALTG